MDHIRELGELALGSRLKRLSDKIMGQVAQGYQLAEVEFEPRWFPIFSLLAEYGPLGIVEIGEALGISHAAVNQISTELLKAKLIEEDRDSNDGRRRMLKLSKNGRRQESELKLVWGDFRAAVTDLVHKAGVDLMGALDAVESALEAESFSDRFRRIRRKREDSDFEIVKFKDSLSPHFKRLNLEWIEKHFRVEESDKKTLSYPKQYIVDPGGEILFVIDRSSGEVLGTCALMAHPDGTFELTKMAVTKSAQGKGLGRKLAVAMIDVARERGLKSIFLETNSRLSTAIQLYRTLGFKVVPFETPPGYERADVRMVLSLSGS